MICETCGKQYNGQYGSGRFCSEFCAHSYVGSRKTKETKKKISLSISKEHVHICPKCKKEFKHIGTAPNILCDECRKEKYKCKYCGSLKGQCRRPEICKSYQLFPKMIKLFRMDQKAIGTEKLYDEYDRISKEIQELYYNKKLSIPQIKELIGYKSSSGSLSKFLAHFIHFRSSSDAIQNAFLNNRIKKIPIQNIKFKTGYHTTWNNKKVLFRSSYEEDFCKELDKRKLDYSMESLRIRYFDSQKQKYRIAIPDFFIPSLNLIVEVKSSFTLDVKNMYDKVLVYKSLSYNFMLVLNRVYYKDMEYFIDFNVAVP